MAEMLLDHLAFLYGAARARKLLPRVESLVAKYKSSGGRQRGSAERLGLSERDALLITYADQVQEEGVPPLRSLAAFAEQELSGLVSGLHILPFYPWSSDDGFSVRDFFAVDPAYGGWAEIERLGRSFDLMLDGVFNHMSAKSEWFRGFREDDPRYREFFVTVKGHPDLSGVVRPRALPLLTEFETAKGRRRVWTTFSADQVDLNYGNPEVLLAILEVLLFYVSKGARFIRLDAVAFLWKEIGTSCLHLPQTHRVVQFFRAVLDRTAPGVLLVTETNVPHAENMAYFGDGANEAQMIYNFALPPLVLHALSTGSAEKLMRWAQSLKAPSRRATFFNFLASHDGIGLNPARGILSDAEISRLVERTRGHEGLVSYKQLSDGSSAPYELNINYFDALSSPASCEPVALQVTRFLCAHAVMLAMPGVPGIYFHSLFGSRGDRAGAETSGAARRINRQKLERAQLSRELAAPESLRASVFGGLKALLEIRRGQAAFHPEGAHDVPLLHPGVFALRRTSRDGSRSVLCLQNLTRERVRVEMPKNERGRKWIVLYCGRGADRQEPGSEGGSVQALPDRNLSAGSRGDVGAMLGGSVVLGPYDVRWAASG